MNMPGVFAKLSTRSADYSFMPFSDSVSQVNIALYTKGMCRRAYLAARFVWSKDLSVHSELANYIESATQAYAKQEGWKKSDKPHVLVQLALAEHYAPGVFRTVKSRYQFSGIDERDWFRTWGKRYEMIYSVMCSYLDIANNQ